jgi:hypothetical protein
MNLHILRNKAKDAASGMPMITECIIIAGRRTETFSFKFLSQCIFGKKPFLEFLKAFLDLKVIGNTFPATYF